MCRALLRDPAKPETLISRLPIGEVDDLKKTGVVDKG